LTRQLDKFSNQSAQANFGKQDLDKLKMPIPLDVAEQRKIAEILSTWDEAIALTEQLIAALQQRKKGLMQRLMTGEVRFPGFEDEWQRVTLKDILEIFYGKSQKEIRSEDGRYPIFGTGGIVGRTNTPLCSEPSIIIGRKGSIDQPRLAVSPYWAIDTTFYCPAKSNVDVRWLYYMLSYKGLARYNEGSTIPSLSRTTLQSIRLSLPSLEEQKKISNLLSLLDEVISTNGKKAGLLQIQKKGLMQRLLTGEIRVSVD
jgi:type I restriction enzyme S subunit